MKTFKAKAAPGFFDIDLRIQWLAGKGDPLNRLNEVISWEIFDPIHSHPIEHLESMFFDGFQRRDV